MRLSKILLAMTVLTSLAIAALVLPAGNAAAGGWGTTGKRVVLIVPGQQLYSSGEAHQAPYRALDEALKDAGYETHFVDAPGKVIAADAELIAKSIRTYADDADSVGVLAHSAGGLSSRYYAKFLGGSDIVDSFVAVGAPQYSSPGGCVQGPADGYDTCMFSEVLTKLNAGEDTPGSAYYSVVQSSGEWADGRLAGGQCRVYIDGVPGAGTGADHLAELEHPEVISGAISALGRDCVGTFVDENEGDITWPDTLFPSFR
ncbi:lipase [Rhodococcus sp. IEGM 1409]|uniref:esterase/lipase family protein n=1 Tax=Rhodococcus sp. IEGM 1409 TaxID=3047082 RepID=UPI0024B70E5B|nr:lipase [Rhodococcus sp. IEGM 1409]MDI9899753.1 lipase [Rhodococcus sp. IEGM 1409]